MKNKFSTYKPAKVHTRGGDMDKEWFVEYQYYIHKTQTFKRIRETDGANRIQDPYKRKKHLDNLAKVLNKKLMEGWNPLTNSIEKNVVYSEDSWETCMAIIMEEKRQSTSTSHTQYKYILEYFSEYLRIRRMNTEHPRNITKSLILDYLTWRMNNFKIRRGTRDKDLIILGGAFKVLKIRGIIEHNPCYEIPRLGDRPDRHEPYTAQELQKLLELLAVEDKTMLHFCIFVMAAIRPAEILRLQVKDVNLTEGVVVIKNTKSKNSYGRVARIPGILLRYLADMPLADAPPHYYIFNATGQPAPEQHANKWYWSKHFRKFREALNLRKGVSMYSLKHTILIEMFKNGASMDEMMSYGGFKTLDALQAYLRRHLNHVPADPSERLKQLFSLGIDGFGLRVG
jgi:integrase